MAEIRVVILSSLSALVLVSASGCGLFRQEDPDLREGIAHFADSKWTEAEVSFDRALEREPSLESHFNRGSALYRQGRLDEAGEDFRRVAGARDEAFRSRALLDLGNTEARAGRLDEAIESYRRALELVPGDHDARYNLEWALWTKEQAEKDGDGGESGDEGDDGETNDGDRNQDGDDGRKEQAKNDADEGGDQGERDEQDGEEGSGGEQAQNDPQTSDDDSDNSGTGESSQQQNGPGEQQANNQQQQPDPSDQQQQSGGQGERSEDSQDTPQNDAQAGASAGGEGSEGEAQPQARPMSRQEISEVLDSMRAREQSVPLWRFREGERRQERGTREKDW